MRRGSPAKWRLSFMAGRQERVEPLDRAYHLSSLGGEMEAVARGDRSMQQCRRTSCQPVRVPASLRPSRPACCPHQTDGSRATTLALLLAPSAGRALEKCVHWPVRPCSWQVLRCGRACRPGCGDEDGRAAAARRAPLEGRRETSPSPSTARTQRSGTLACFVLRWHRTTGVTALRGRRPVWRGRRPGRPGYRPRCRQRT
jgi:hypothetical protein